MDRRGFLGSILLACAAPAIGRAANLMPVKMLDSGVLVPEVEIGRWEGIRFIENPRIVLPHPASAMGVFSITPDAPVDVMGDDHYLVCSMTRRFDFISDGVCWRWRDPQNGEIGPTLLKEGVMT